jgi:hypothetical protein
VPSKVQTESTRYKAQLKALVKDGNLSNAEAKALVKEAKSGSFTEVKAHYLIGFMAKFQDKFEPAARETLLKFVQSGQLSSAKIEREFGGPQRNGQPALTIEDTRAGGVKWVDSPGKLTIGGYDADDVMQGALGDCYLLSAMSAVAQSHPELLKKAITTNRDGSYTVTFFEKSDPSKPAKPVKVTIDGSFAMKDGEFEYAAARDPKERWPQIFEKAYAAWKGGYEKIEGGMGADALEALTGAKPGFTLLTPQMTPAAVFEAVKSACADKGCVVALSQPYGVTAKGLVEDHAYTVLGTEEKNGEQLVRLRNPWGSQEPGRDRKDDGQFTMTAAEFMKAYTMIEHVRPR